MSYQVNQSTNTYAKLDDQDINGSNNEPIISYHVNNNNNNNNNNNENMLPKDTDKNDKSEELKDKHIYSLSHYMSTTFNIAMVLFLTSTALLLIWSNNQDGAYVEVKAFPIESTTLYLNNVFNQTDFIDYIESNFNLRLKDNNQLTNDDNLPDCDGFHYCGNVFQFSLTSSIEDFWDSNAYSLAIIIALFSGLWPYIKLLLLGIILLYPIEQEKRSKFLMILDQLGKYSFVDLYVTVFMLVSFYVKIIEKAKVLGIEIVVEVECDVGLSSFTIATLVSMLYSMIFIYVDTKYAKPEYMKKKLFKDLEEKNDNESAYISESSAMNQNSVDGTPKFKFKGNQNNSFYGLIADSAQSNEIATGNISTPKQMRNNDNSDNMENDIQNPPEFDSNKIFKYIAGLKHDDNKNYNQYKTLLLYADDKYQNIGPLFLYYKPESYCGIITRAITLTLMICNIYMVLLSLETAPVRFDLHGLTGAFVADPIRSNTMIENCNLLDTVTDTKATAILVVVVYYITIIIAPILVMISLSFIWVFPFFMNYNIVFHYLKEVTLVLQAWSGIDVYLLGSIAASVEIGEVSDWILNTNFPGVCGSDGVIQNIFGVGCFSVQGNLIYGTLLLGIAVVIEWYSVIYTLRYLHKIDIDWNTRIILNQIVYKKDSMDKKNDS